MGRRPISILALLLSLLWGLCLSAGALSEVEDRQDCTLTLLLGQGDDGSALEGGTIALYLAAGIGFEGGPHYDPALGQFAGAKALSELPTLTQQELDSENAALTEALLRYAREQKIQPRCTAPVSAGKVTFADLPVGLYLLSQTEAAGDGRTMRSFLLSLPDGDGHYNVTAAPKPGISPPTPVPPTEPTQAPSEPGGERPKIPQTGQLWLPVPVLALSGLGLAATGALLRRREDRA